MTQRPTIVWFRQDLRLSDNAALSAAVQAERPVIPVFIWAPSEEAPWQRGGASRWWLHQSLTALTDQLAHAGSRLIIRTGDTGIELEKLARSVGATQIVCNRCVEPARVTQDARVKRHLSNVGIELTYCGVPTLHAPDVIKTRQGTPYRVFTPFWKQCQTLTVPAPLPPPSQISPPDHWPTSRQLSELKLDANLPWSRHFGTIWTPGERSAMTRLQEFAADGVSQYTDRRDRPDQAGTAQLSAHLHFGEISPRQIWAHLCQHVLDSTTTWHHSEAFLRQVVWREFAYYLLHHIPASTISPLRPEFATFPWHEGKADTLRRWQQGETGYPFVDAGMRQLWETGWMHNRTRMVVASFLTKHLLIHWQNGAHWFWDTLVDADLANNTMGWQWVAGCGADAAPFTRIFNPVLQGEKFDPNGDYVRRWVPELATLPSPLIHAPWRASESELQYYGIRLDHHYPRPMIRHDVARLRAQAAFDFWRNKPATNKHPHHQPS